LNLKDIPYTYDEMEDFNGFISNTLYLYFVWEINVVKVGNQGLGLNKK